MLNNLRIKLASWATKVTTVISAFLSTLYTGLSRTGAWLHRYLGKMVPYFQILLDTVAKWQTLIWLVFGMLSIGINIPFLSAYALVGICTLFCVAYGLIQVYWKEQNDLEKLNAAAMDSIVHLNFQDATKLQREIIHRQETIIRTQKSQYQETLSRLSDVVSRLSTVEAQLQTAQHDILTLQEAQGATIADPCPSSPAVTPLKRAKTTQRKDNSWSAPIARLFHYNTTPTPSSRRALYRSKEDTDMEQQAPSDPTPSSANDTQSLPPHGLPTPCHMKPNASNFSTL